MKTTLQVLAPGRGYRAALLGLLLGGTLLFNLTPRAWGQCFQPAVGYGTGSRPYSVAVGDFNKDGKPDLAVANYSSGNVAVLLGKGDGSFQPAVGYPTGFGTISVAVGDFNGDTKPDLAVANFNRDNVSVLLGKGDGTFEASVGYGVGDGPQSVAVGDFNGDGKTDLAVVNELSTNVAVLLGKGDGTFEAAVGYGTGSKAYSVAVGDFNKDGKPDLVTANYYTANVAVLLGKGDGTFEAAVGYPTGLGPLSVAVGDFNGDTKPDLAVANSNSDNVAVLLGKGDGTFEAAVGYGTGVEPRSVAVGDFNGDTKPDLAVANANSANVAVLLGKGDGTFEAAVGYGTGDVPLSVAVGDFNGDGRPDLVTANNFSDNVAVLLNAAAARLSGQAPTTPGQACPGQSLAVTFQATGGCPTTAFTVELSNAVGSFANPRVLGTAAPGTTNLPLPTNLPTGTGYRVRVVGSGQTSPASLPFRIEGPSLAGVTPAVGGVPVCRGGQATLSFSLPSGGCPFPGGNAFTAQLSSATGSFNNLTNLGPVAPGQSTVTIPASVAAGTGYRIRLVSSNPALTSSSSAPFQVKTCNARLSAEEPTLVVAPNPVSGRDIRVRVGGMDNPAFTLTNGVGRHVGVEEKTGGSGQWVLTPRQALSAGVYLLQASEGDIRLTTRVLVME